MKPPRSPDELARGGIVSEKSLREHLDKLNKVMSNISFGSMFDNTSLDSNMDHWKISGTTPGANVEFAVAHGLGRIPLTLGPWDTNNGGVLYRSTTPWTNKQVFLKCTTATAAYRAILV